MVESTATDENVVLTRVRLGLKPKLAFALKSQSQFSCWSLGQTRSRRKHFVTNSSHTNSLDVTDETDEANLEFEGPESIILQQNKISNKIVLNRLPSKSKELLKTGLLEDFRVRYLRGPKRTR